MNYHNIIHDDMRNGDGLRVTIFLSGCDHYCKNCHNPQTWDPFSGIPFDNEALLEILEQLDKPYISGITFSGGDPLNKCNVDGVAELIDIIKFKYPDKTIWLYTGFTYDAICNDIKRKSVVDQIDVLVDGPFIEQLADATYPWAGSTNQHIIKISEQQ